MEITEEYLERYSRHILLKEVGGPGQKRLNRAKVLIIGAGGLGSPNILYLAAAGVGTIGIVDDDVVELSNLQRQVCHNSEEVGNPKVESAKKCALRINPNIQINVHNERLDSRNSGQLISKYDIVADGSDNFDTRLVVNDSCYAYEKPLVSAAINRFDGQISTFKAFQRKEGSSLHTCYRCFVPNSPPQENTISCAETGVLGALCGVVGSIQATEVIKEIVGFGKSLSGSLFIVDGLCNEFRKISLPPDPNCPLCGLNPTITKISQRK